MIKSTKTISTMKKKRKVIVRKKNSNQLRIW